MRILLTGATSFIGKALYPELLAAGHEVVCCVRNKEKFLTQSPHVSEVEIWQVDFFNPIDPDDAPRNIDAAYYLIHSLDTAVTGYASKDATLARHFTAFATETHIGQVIYLGGIANQRPLSRHLASRLEVEKILQGGNYRSTMLRAAVVVGTGSASFEILREICQKAPLLTAPRWIKTLCQPIYINDAIAYLTGVLGNEACMDQVFDIGGSEVLSYKAMIVQLAKALGRSLEVIILPFYTPPEWSAPWSIFLQSAPIALVANLLESMAIEVVCRDDSLERILKVNPTGYSEAIRIIVN